jgi:AcrR family transcriptional regulator
VSKSAASTDWREARRDAAREAIVDAAWDLVREEGLAGLSLRDLAKRAGITTPTVYAYFDSKLAIYDAMFGRAATEFADWMDGLDLEAEDARERLAVSLHKFVAFCTGDVARYQLLFQRTIPDFEPSPESYAPAVRALDGAVALLASVGITDPRQVDLWTACTVGLVDQQIANDPGGDRWVQLIDDMVDMYLAHCLPTARTTRRSHR